MASPHSASAYGSYALAIQPLYARLYIDHDVDQSRRPRHTWHRHTADVLWLFSLSTFGFTLITTLISHDGIAALGIGTRQMCFASHDGVAALGIGTRQMCFGYSASLRSALH